MGEIAGVNAVPDGWESIGLHAGRDRFLEVDQGPWLRVRVLSRKGRSVSVEDPDGRRYTVDASRLHFQRPIPNQVH